MNTLIGELRSQLLASVCSKIVYSEVITCINIVTPLHL